MRRNLAWRPDLPSKAEGWPVPAPEPGAKPATDSRQDYWRDLVVAPRSDGGWLCVHQQPLELCPVCIFLMDRRYERTQKP